MNKKRVAFLTLGCKVNSYETDAMIKLFLDKGYEVVEFNGVADIYIVNTCSVTNMADRKSRQMLHKARKNNDKALIVATGCYVQASVEEAGKDEAIDLLIGNNKKKEIVEIVERFIDDKGNKESVIDINDTKLNIEYEDMHIESTGENTRAYIKIQDGCNQFCSYCIIPYARGRIRSRKKESILEEVNALARNGYKEIVLTGIHISSYGLDFENEKIKGFKYEYLLDVIESIADIEGVKRIRLGSLEPRIVSDEFIEKLYKIDKVCPHFHLSLQSGCDETLKRMNRKYTTDEYEKGCNILRKYFDNPAITTDVIVGFAGETEEEFSQTVRFLEKINFAEMHIFKYSIRKGTVAAKMSNQVREEVKTSRSKVLLDMNEKNHKNYMESFVGKEEFLLVEEEILIENKKYYVGHNERYLKIIINIDGDCSAEKQDGLENKIIKVKISKIFDAQRLIGTRCQ